MHKRAAPLSPHDGSQGKDDEQGDTADRATALEQDPEVFSFALDALSEMSEAGADTPPGHSVSSQGSLSSGLEGGELAADLSEESEDERIRRLQSALDSYKDWLSSI